MTRNIEGVTFSRRGVMGIGLGVVGGASFLSLSACASDTPSEGASGGLSPALKGIGHTISGVASIDDYAHGFKHSLSQLGQEYSELDYRGDAGTFLSQAESMGGLGAKMSVTYFLSDAVVLPYIKTLVRQGIYHGNLDSNAPWTIPADQQFDGKYVITTHAPQIAGAYVIAKELFKRMGGVGDFIHVKGFKGAAADDERTIGVNRALSEFPGIRKVAEAAANWDRQTAQDATESLLAAHPNTTGIFAQNDDEAIGVVNALRAARKDGVAVAGFDGVTDFVKMLADGQDGLTASTVTGWQGALQGAMLFDASHGFKFSPLETMMTFEPVMIDNANAAKAYLSVLDADPFPYDAKKLSRVVSGDSWDPQNLCRVTEPEKIWGNDGRGVPAPDNFSMPSDYASALTDDLERVNTSWKGRYSVDPFKTVRDAATIKDRLIDIV